MGLYFLADSLGSESDAALFSVSSAGIVSVAQGELDFDNAIDANFDNVYEFSVTYTSGSNSVTENVKLTVTDTATVTSAANTATTVEQYDQTNMSIAYAINDDLSVSYEVEKSTAVTVGEADTDVEQKSTGIQLAYNMGGMTLALVRNSHDNPSYSSTAADEDQTLIAVTMAF